MKITKDVSIRLLKERDDPNNRYDDRIAIYNNITRKAIVLFPEDDITADELFQEYKTILENIFLNNMAILYIKHDIEMIRNFAKDKLNGNTR